jgi:type VI secretion system protein ImpE
MSASDLFKAGQLQEAITSQLQEVKANPADHAKRLFLFELLAFAGEWDRARRQIDAITYDDLQLEAAVREYRQLVDAEQARRRLFKEGVPPNFLAEPPEHVQLRLAAVNHLRENRPAEAVALLNQAAAAVPALQGNLNDKRFDSLRDCDDLFGTVLEVMAHGNYYWVPLEQVAALTMNPPKFPRDLLWIPARLEMRDDSAGNVFLSALYPGSHEQQENQLKLGRATDWKEMDGLYLGMGLRMFLAGEEAVVLLDWRKLELT